MRVREVVAGSLIAAPLIFYWTLEVGLASGPYSLTCYLFGGLSNGFITVDGCQAYHITMYLLFVVCVVAAALLIEDSRE
jgi:hypothetical protein